MENNIIPQSPLEKSKTPKLLLATIGFLLPFAISSCSSESIPKNPDRKVDPIKIQELNPTQKEISDLRKFAPVSNDVPEGVVKFQFGKIYRVDISDPYRTHLISTLLPTTLLEV
jgi:hypothetical protein